MKGDVQRAAIEMLEPLYTAEFSPDGWPSFLTRLMTAIGSDVAIAVPLDRQARPVEFICVGEFSAGMMSSYEEHFAAIDPWAKAFLSLERPFGKNVCSQELLSPAAFERTEYYNDFWRPNHDLFYTCGALINVGGNMANVGMPRCRDRGAYDQSDIAFLDALSPHIKAALQMRQTLREAHQVAAGAEAALATMHDALVIADPAGRIVYANSSGEAELRSGLLVSGRSGRLRPGVLVPANEFEKAFSEAASVSKLAACVAPASVVASQEPDALERASLSFYPLPPSGSEAVHLSTGSSVLLIICRANGAPVGSARLLRKLYGMTVTEAQIALSLSSGISLEDAAVAMRMKIGTARVHLKHVFQKTGTRRQAQLAAHLNQVAPRTRMD